MNTKRNEQSNIPRGLKCPSQEMRTPVKPLPATVEAVLIEWLVALTSINPISPQIAPQRMRVRTMTFLVLMPMYLAVFSLSPTTANS